MNNTKPKGRRPDRYENKQLNTTNAQIRRDTEWNPFENEFRQACLQLISKYPNNFDFTDHTNGSGKPKEELDHDDAQSAAGDFTLECMTSQQYTLDALRDGKPITKKTYFAWKRHVELKSIGSIKSKTSLPERFRIAFDITESDRDNYLLVDLDPLLRVISSGQVEIGLLVENITERGREYFYYDRKMVLENMLGSTGLEYEGKGVELKFKTLLRKSRYHTKRVSDMFKEIIDDMQQMMMGSLEQVNTTIRGNHSNIPIFEMSEYKAGRGLKEGEPYHTVRFFENMKPSRLLKVYDYKNPTQAVRLPRVKVIAYKKPVHMEVDVLTQRCQSIYEWHQYLKRLQQASQPSYGPSLFQ